MKVLLFALSFVFTFTLSAKEKIYYTILSATFDSSLPTDSVTIKGIVSYQKKPASNSFGKVASLDFSVANIVSRSGEYQIQYRKSAGGFYFFQEGYREVVVNLGDYSEANRFEINIYAEEFFALIQLEKPVIYLYNDTPTKTDLTLAPNGDLSFTYPQYDRNWQVETQENGDIKNLKTGKIHPYLFWEANQTKLDFKKKANTIEGYVIRTDTSVQFLEHQLTNLGLNTKEATDFITYWAPRLMQKPFATIQFTVGKDYDKVFGGIQSSTPLDYRLRIGMLYEITDVEPSVKIKAPQQTFAEQRHGFTLIEWGGIELKNKLILL